MTAPRSDESRADARADVVIIGGGIVGLAIAAAAADRDLSVTLVTAERPGAAARAAAGLLVPHYGADGAVGAVERFMTAARDRYPSYVRWAEERSGLRIPFDASGALEVAHSPTEREALDRAAPSDARSLSAADVALLEPALAATSGGVLHPVDGAVDNVRLTDALATIVSRHGRVRTVREAATRLGLSRDSATVIGEAGTRVSGGRAVLAAGAWSGGLAGLPRPIPVRPVRGQICAVRGTPLRHVVLGSAVYMVARGGDRTLIGSTMEDVGFDPGTTPSAIEGLRRAAGALCPSLSGAPILEAWSGLRPVTPDLLPVLGPDPEYPALIYACGHSRNGILLAPITAAVTAAMVVGATTEWNVAPFGIARFARSPGSD